MQTDRNSWHDWSKKARKFQAIAAGPFKECHKAGCIEVFNQPRNSLHSGYGDFANDIMSVKSTLNGDTNGFFRSLCSSWLN